MINARAVHKGARMDKTTSGTFITTAGTFESKRTIKVRKVSFPEFSVSR